MQYRQINLLILLIYHRENVEISILYVRMPSIACSFQQILWRILHTPGEIQRKKNKMFSCYYCFHHFLSLDRLMNKH